MNATEFRAVLDLWMCRDNAAEVDAATIHAWLYREATERGYTSVTDAYHRHKAEGAQQS